MNEITSALAEGDTVKLSSFGSFSIRQKGQRVGRNPKTGEEVPILPRRVLVFRPSQVLKNRINRGLDRKRPIENGHRQYATRPTGRFGEKSPAAFRTIAEVAVDLDLPQHVLRFWESRFPQIKPLKRRGGRRYYRPEDIALLRTHPQPSARAGLYDQGRTAAAAGRRGARRHRKSPGRGSAGSGAAGTKTCPAAGEIDQRVKKSA